MKELPPRAETLVILIWKIDAIKFVLQASEYHLCKSKYSWYELKRTMIVFPLSSVRNMTRGRAT